MHDLGDIAQRLRDVKEATRNFLTLWAVEQMRHRVQQGSQTVEQIDTAALEAAIMELDVYATPSLLRGVLADD